MDRRVRKTRKALEDAFIALEHQKPAAQITVAELTALADVGRGTFYLHYQDVADLQEQLVTTHIETLLDRFAQTPPVAIDGSYHSWLNSLLAYLQSDKAALGLLQRTKLDASVYRRIRDAFASQLSGSRLDVMYVVSGSMGIIADWLAAKLDCDQATLVALLDEKLQQLTH
ncbi:TetR/AcrR family transcriptional regulator [Lacticaseibacillus sp. GG6-2]